MSIITLVGIDPGIKNTGAVAMTLTKRGGFVDYDVTYEALPGSDLESIQEYCSHYAYDDFGLEHVYVEKYRDRGTTFRTHGAMRQLEVLIKRTIPKVELIDNTGIKNIVTTEMLKLLGMWDFSDKRTHHQDIRSAARIMLYGALEVEDLNAGYLYPLITRLLEEKTP